MVTSAFMRHYILQRRVRHAVIHAAKRVATFAVPVALSLGVSSLGAVTLSPSPALAQSGSTVLTNGDQGETVTRLQQRLTELGFFSGEATGFYGPLTEEAVIRYQNSQGLLADGVAGPETLGALLPQPAPQRTSLQIGAAQLQGIQAKLSRLGFYLGAVDGIYGPQTEAAINSFQNVYALPVTGVTDRRTLATLNRVHSQTSGSSTGNTVSVGSNTVSVGSSTTQPFPRTVTQTQISTASVSLPPAIPSGPSLVTSIPKTTTISSPLPPPSLPDGQASFGNSNFGNGNFNNGNFGNGNFNNGNFGSLPPIGNNGPAIRQTPQVAAAPRVTGYPYIVAVPVKTGATLAEVRQAASSAFLAGSKRGTYIQAGAYNSREEAERATQILRDRRLDARVVYRPN